jgi:hypothetical protein
MYQDPGQQDGLQQELNKGVIPHKMRPFVKGFRGYYRGEIYSEVLGEKQYQKKT